MRQVDRPHPALAERRLEKITIMKQERFHSS
jgi:hypothetical protein